MKTIAYTSPFVPPEWIAAHGLRPCWMRLRAAGGRSPVGLGRGVCPYAGALTEAARRWGQTLKHQIGSVRADLAKPQAHDRPPDRLFDILRSDPITSAVVVTTACDQMRYAAAVLQQEGELPVFLFNVPSTWQSAAAGRLYFDELRRLGRFLVRLGGKAPDGKELGRVMLEYDDARAAVREARPHLSARQFAEALAGLRGGETSPPSLAASPRPALRGEAASGGGGVRAGVPLALLGGPLLERDYALLDRIEQAGGRVVLDATEGGERTMPPAFDRRRLRDEPLAELALAYFENIPDVFRRPNSGLYEWLARQLAARSAQGIIFRRYVWCDLWHAELHRLREQSGVPVLDIDVDGDDGGTLARTMGRLEAFLEMLR